MNELSFQRVNSDDDPNQARNASNDLTQQLLDKHAQALVNFGLNVNLLTRSFECAPFDDQTIQFGEIVEFEDGAFHSEMVSWASARNKPHFVDELESDRAKAALCHLVGVANFGITMVALTTIIADAYIEEAGLELSTEADVLPLINAVIDTHRNTLENAVLRLEEVSNDEIAHTALSKVTSHLNDYLHETIMDLQEV